MTEREIISWKQSFAEWVMDGTDNIHALRSRLAVSYSIVNGWMSQKKGAKGNHLMPNAEKRAVIDRMMKATKRMKA